MTLRYTCKICGEVMEADTEENVVELAHLHFRNQHGMQRESDVEPPAIDVEDDEIIEDIEEKD